ncbi:hypothetical protein BaRGS_00021428 [Batillaria attramentaria]|uniref:G-protein coupled receptors family 1 profile domain-containing protein n=1 Tax=Batillaria attramentaria TaxID=370345 RepID=A0ABD0KJI0_9CAEN
MPAMQPICLMGVFISAFVVIMWLHHGIIDKLQRQELLRKELKSMKITRTAATATANDTKVLPPRSKPSFSSVGQSIRHHSNPLSERQSIQSIFKPQSRRSHSVITLRDDSQSEEVAARALRALLALRQPASDSSSDTSIEQDTSEESFETRRMSLSTSGTQSAWECLSKDLRLLANSGANPFQLPEWRRARTHAVTFRNRRLVTDEAHPLDNAKHSSSQLVPLGESPQNEMVGCSLVQTLHDLKEGGTDTKVCTEEIHDSELRRETESKRKLQVSVEDDCNVKPAGTSAVETEEKETQSMELHSSSSKVDQKKTVPLPPISSATSQPQVQEDFSVVVDGYESGIAGSHQPPEPAVNILVKTLRSVSVAPTDPRLYLASAFMNFRHQISRNRRMGYTTMTTIVITCLFFLGCFPHFLVEIILAFHGITVVDNARCDAATYAALHIARNSQFLSFALNPIFYSMVSPGFRQACRRVCCGARRF